MNKEVIKVTLDSEIGEILGIVCKSTQKSYVVVLDEYSYVSISKATNRVNPLHSATSTKVSGLRSPDRVSLCISVVFGSDVFDSEMVLKNKDLSIPDSDGDVVKWARDLGYLVYDSDRIKE